MPQATVDPVADLIREFSDPALFRLDRRTSVMRNQLTHHLTAAPTATALAAPPPRRGLRRARARGNQLGARLRRAVRQRLGASPVSRLNARLNASSDS